jgi:phage tail-like protein
VSAQSADVTNGAYFVFMSTGLIQGARFYTAVSGAHTYRIKLWHPDASQLRTVDVPCSGPGVYDAIFASSYEVTLDDIAEQTFSVGTATARFCLSMYETTGTYWTRSTAAELSEDYRAGYWLASLYYPRYTDAGDVRPTSYGAGYQCPIDVLGYGYADEEPLYPVRVQVPRSYLDHVESDAPTGRIALINTIPQNAETNVRDHVNIRLTIASLDNQALDTDALVYVRINQGAKVLAYDQAGSGFQSGWDGSASLATVQQSPGSSVNDELVLSIDPTSDFASQARVDVYVEASASAATLDTRYTFYIQDLTVPELEAIFWLTPTWARVKFTEAMARTSTVGSALYYQYYDGGAEVVAPNIIRLQGSTLSESMVGLWFGLAGSVFPQNNGYKKIVGVDTASGQVQLDTAVLVADDGIDKSDAGFVVLRRPLRACITPYRFYFRIDEEGASESIDSADKIQVAYEAIINKVESVPVAELPSAADPDEYIYLKLQDSVSLNRLYRLEANLVQDTSGNAMSDEALDFTSPSFGEPTNRLNFWSPGIIPSTDQQDDLEHDGQLRRMAVVLNDIMDQLWYRTKQVEYLDDPYSCPSHWIDHLLYNLGNPFTFPLETELDRRKLANGLEALYKRVGTKKGITDMLYAILGINFTIKAYVTEGGWLIGIAGSGELGQNTVLAVSSDFAKNCYEIWSPVALTEEQRRIVKEVATWADPVDMHLVRFVEFQEGYYYYYYQVLDTYSLPMDTPPGG